MIIYTNEYVQSLLNFRVILYISDENRAKKSKAIKIIYLKAPEIKFRKITIQYTIF